ncbi:hypothetical protein CDAR_223341 [Caerostris darwini]|uniref:Uncharacterized protein n=1 Tax=Caerostris darwini TaxID=1538125 RepID=A0AAV4W9H3_9ARAC|nr:hypothetical protein CDAR_223341 [Caerostris darwini]
MLSAFFCPPHPHGQGSRKGQLIYEICPRWTNDPTAALLCGHCSDHSLTGLLDGMTVAQGIIWYVMEVPVAWALSGIGWLVLLSWEGERGPHVFLSVFGFGLYVSEWKS